MKQLIFIIILAPLMIANAVSQEQLGVSLELTMANGSGKKQVLTVGLMDEATSGIDPMHGEAELPPMPPAELFDVRCVSTPGVSQLGLGTLVDYRSYESSGGAENETYTISYQGGTDATSVTVSWSDELPGRVTKLVIDGEDMSGKTSLTTSFASGQLTMDVMFNTTPLAFEATPNPLTFTVDNVNPPPVSTLTITPTGDAGASWTLDTDVEWIDIVPTEGRGKQDVTVTVTTQQLPAGDHEGTIFVRSEAFPANLDVPVRMTMIVGIEDLPMPGEIRLSRNYPNPVNSSTMIDLELGSMQTSTGALLTVHDVLGRQIMDLSPLLHGRTGAQQVEVHTHALPDGVYLYKLSVGPVVRTRKMTVIH